MFRIIINLFFLVISVMLLWIFAKPEWAEISRLKKEKVFLEDTLINIQKIQRLRDQQLESYNSISSENREKLNHFLPQSEDKAAFVLMIDNIAKSRGIFLKSISVQENKENQRSLVLNKDKKDDNENNSNKPSVSIIASGSYSSFRGFLSDLEKNVRVIDVSNVVFNSSKTDNYEYKIDGYVYWKKAESKIDAGKISALDYKEVLNLLSTLEDLKLNIDFLESPSFKDLKDFYTKIEVSAEEYGRTNPFSSF